MLTPDKKKYKWPPKHVNNILIDADMLVYTLGYASEVKTTFFGSDTFVDFNFDRAKRLIQGRVDSVVRRLGAKDYQLILSEGGGNWRFAFYADYKQNRKTLTKPVGYEDIRAWIASKEECIVTDELEEADDFISKHLTWYKEFATLKNDSEVIAVTADKDFYTIPGLVFNMSANRLFHISVEQTFSFLFFQALCGDRVDGYYGVKWVGERKAMRLLQSCKGMTIRQAYLNLKSLVKKRAGKKDLQKQKGLWKQFRICLDLASLMWYNETGQDGIGLRRVYKYRKLNFSYFLPYYDPLHNLRFGIQVKD